MVILRPGQRHVMIPGYGVSVRAGRNTLHGGGWSPTDWWTVVGKTCVAAFQPKGAPSLGLSYVNLANPGTYDAGVGVAPVLDATHGWSSSGGNWYLTTTIVPSGSHTYIVRFTNGNTAFAPLLASDLTLRMSITMNWGGAISYFCNGANVNGVFPTIGQPATGVAAIAGKRCFLDGSYVAIDSSTGDPAGTVFINSWSSSPAANENNIQAVAIYSDPLTDGEVDTVSAAMAAL